ncbi:MAG: methionine gamma-lyase family protein [Clostridia bacterium]|nr:methionine gamma-lyase family protein [Clostridia bacterium]
MKEVGEALERAEDIARYNTEKVLSAFIKNHASESKLAASTGYGYGDAGRETLEAIWADVMGAEDSIIRHNFMSGTHAICIALFGILRPGDSFISATGRPYDTLVDVIGIDKQTDGSLKDFGVEYRECPLKEGRVDITRLCEMLKKKSTKMVYIQRSRGYSLRPSLTVEDIEEIAVAVKKVQPDVIVAVDNCYGEFTQKKEPTEVGADLIIGSLIKNAGGGIAPTGGYIAGKRDLVEKCANRLTTPSTGKEIGSTLGHSRELYMGVFNAPHVTGEALKTAIFASALFSKFGYEVTPQPNEDRGDIIQAICLKNSESLIAFCEGIQAGAPMDSFVRPEPWDMPGYDSKVIMAAGAFTQGASVELSADAPLREPFAVWLQGGLTFDSARIGILLAAQQMIDKKILG